MTASTDRLPAGAAAGTARLPDFFVAGHAKCGTTAIYEMLVSHPQIWMPAVKEPRYFASDMRRRFTPPRSGPLPETMDDYLALFRDAPADAVVGEASPSYIASHSAPRLIARHAPRAKIVAIFREPASFLRSLHLQLVQSHVETVRDLRTALSLENERAHGRRIPRRSHRPQALQYSDHVRYTTQLRRYHEHFPREQVHVLIYDDLRADNDAVMRGILRFLEVDATIPLAASEANPSVLIRSQQLEQAMNAVSAGRGPLSGALRGPIKALVPRGARRAALRAAREHLVRGEPPAPDDALMRTLRRRYAEEVRSFGDYVGRDLISLWNYDRQ
ncbi:MAG TPA: sulfotransferase [Solirubrobacteraceae bacterium]|nr:sulfotransferase [Solirubrobacteraceae bacterium]